MKKIILLLFSVSLAVLFSFGKTNSTKETLHSLITDTIPQKKDSVAVNSCLKCHSKLTDKKVIHKPVTNECNVCHQSNGEVHPKEDVEGFKLVKAVPELCFDCHKKENIIKEQVHTPLKDGDCFSCHDVHSSKGEHLVSIPAPGLCYSCHSDLKKDFEGAAVKHSAVTEKKSCMNCHSPHSSSEKKNVLMPQPDVCFTCHDKQIKVGDRTIPNMKKLITKSKYVHGAMDMGGCTACHNPHFSDKDNLLKESFPASNYSAAKKENYALCMGCHEPALFEEEKTTEATGFRDKDLNLHYLHVNKEKGRTCINCHNVHASNKLYLIKDNVKFGQWDFQMNYTRLPKGGTCAPGCHTEKTYTR